MPIDKLKKKKTREEIEEERKARAEAKGLTYVPEEVGRARAAEREKERVAGGEFIDPKTGLPSGVELPGGRTFLGLSPDEVAEIQRRKGLTPGAGEGMLPFSEQAKQRAMGEEATAREPGRVELDIERKGIAKAPIVGPGAMAMGTLVLKEGINRMDEGPEKEAYKKTSLFEEPLIQNPETIRQEYLQEIQKQVIKEGITEGEKFGVLIEAIPLIGGLVAKYVGALIETPGGNAAIVMGNILNEKERALNTAEMVRSGRLPVDTALIRLDGIEDNIVRLEQRIKLLALASSTLIAEGDTLNRWETEILRTRERIEDARTSAFNKRAGIIEPETSVPLIDAGLRAGESVW